MRKKSPRPSPPVHAPVQVESKNVVGTGTVRPAELQQFAIFRKLSSARGSLDLIARAPLSGIQLDRAWVNSICTDDIARRVCEAGIVSAKALHIMPVAAGVDTEAQR